MAKHELQGYTSIRMVHAILILIHLVWYVSTCNHITFGLDIRAGADYKQENSHE